MIDNITYRQYLQLDNDKQAEYNFYIRYAIRFNQSIDVFKIGDLTEQKFGLVKDLQFDVEQGLSFSSTVEYIAKIKNKKQSIIANCYLDKLCQQRKYLISEIERISEIESIALSYTPTADEINAGIEQLNSLGSYLQFRSIAQALNITINDVKAMRYDEAFLELVAQKKINDYQDRLQKIIANKK